MYCRKAALPGKKKHNHAVVVSQGNVVLARTMAGLRGFAIRVTDWLAAITPLHPNDSLPYVYEAA
jgi:hypothetical protein